MDERLRFVFLVQCPSFSNNKAYLSFVQQCNSLRCCTDLAHMHFHVRTHVYLLFEAHLNALKGDSISVKCVCHMPLSEAAVSQPETK